jgi:2-phosphosulfolactate phosphatase
VNVRPIGDDPTEQPGFGLRLGWGLKDVERLAPVSDALVIVDVLRFTTAVSVATARGAVILPIGWDDPAAAARAEAAGAELAGRPEDGCRWSLSPVALLDAPTGLRLMLPSPNGSRLSARAAELCPIVVAGSLRNATAVAGWLAARAPDVVTVIAAGERWPAAAGDPVDGRLRPAAEDLLGAGRILAALCDAASPSPEAAAGIAVARALSGTPDGLHAAVAGCISGRELARRGCSDDVEAAAALDADDVTPVLLDGCFRAG